MAQKHLFTTKYISLLAGVLLTFFSTQVFAGVKHAKSPMSASALRKMARVYMTYGNYDKARGYAENALRTVQDSDAGIGEQALCMIDLATVYAGLDKLSESEKLFTSGIALQRQALFEDHPYVAQTCRMLSDVQRRAGDLDKAEESLAQAVSIMLHYCDIQSSEMSPFILESAKLSEARADYEKAQANYLIALDMAEQQYGSHHLMTANILESMAHCAMQQDAVEQADEYITRAIRIQRDVFGRLNPLMADVLLTKARICRTRGRLDRSEYYLSQATASVEKSRDVVTLARVYERVNQIRNGDIVAVVVN